MAISLIETASLDTGLVAPTATALTTASGSAPSYSARAWVNFNGTGTVAIRASGNVSSITDNGTGDYTVNFTTAMADANYSAVTDGQIVVGVADITTQIAAAGFSTGSFRMNSQSNSANTLTDSPLITAAIFR
jgi:hypothetical protein